MKTISLNLPEAIVETLEAIVKAGRYANRSEILRVATRDFLIKEFPLEFQAHCLAPIPKEEPLPQGIPPFEQTKKHIEQILKGE